MLGKCFCRITPRCNHFPHDVAFYPFCKSERFAVQNQFIGWSNGKLREGTYRPVQSYVAMEIRAKLYLPSGNYDLFKEKEDDR